MESGGKKRELKTRSVLQFLKALSLLYFEIPLSAGARGGGDKHSSGCVEMDPWSAQPEPDMMPRQSHMSRGTSPSKPNTEDLEGSSISINQGHHWGFSNNLTGTGRALVFQIHP